VTDQRKNLIETPFKERKRERAGPEGSKRAWIGLGLKILKGAGLVRTFKSI
jgi:hypothetical protein